MFIGLDTLESTSTTQNVTIIGNNLTVVADAIIGRGKLLHTKIIGNTIRVTEAPLTQPAIWIDQGATAGGGFTGDPADTIVTGNIIPDFTYSATGPVVQLYGGGLFSNNTITGTYVSAVSLAGGNFYGCGNRIAPSSSHTLFGLGACRTSSRR